MMFPLFGFSLFCSFLWKSHAKVTTELVEILCDFWMHFFTFLHHAFLLYDLFVYQPFAKMFEVSTFGLHILGTIDFFPCLTPLERLFHVWLHTSASFCILLQVSAYFCKFLQVSPVTQCNRRNGLRREPPVLKVCKNPKTSFHE